MPSFFRCSITAAIALTLLSGCRKEEAKSDLGASAAVLSPAEKKKEEALIDRMYPLHARVTGVHLALRLQPDAEAPPVGWVRMGAWLRLKEGRKRGPQCRSGWMEVHPKGWICSGQGLEIRKQAPSGETKPQESESALPFDYYFVKEYLVPEFHRPPSRNEQRATSEFVAQVQKLKSVDADKARKAAEGQITIELPRPAVVRRFLDRGFYVAGVGFETRASRRFLRTVTGTFVKESHLELRRGSDFHGVELEGRSLPLAFAVRAGRPLLRRNKADGSIRFVEDPEAEVIARHSLIEGWEKREEIDGKPMHVLKDGHYLRGWFLAVVEAIKPPKRTRDDEPWVHVDLSEQTLVLYRGKTPLFATLVSTGLPDFKTPVGVFTMERKYRSEPMSALGPDAGDERYRIDDVPWTQYFHRSMALHGAFWHDRFGLPRSHGCVNLSPQDAQRVFSETWPTLPPGWHGVATRGTGFPASRVVVTE